MTEREYHIDFDLKSRKEKTLSRATNQSKLSHEKKPKQTKKKPKQRKQAQLRGGGVTQAGVTSDLDQFEEPTADPEAPGPGTAPPGTPGTTPGGGGTTPGGSGPTPA